MMMLALVIRIAVVLTRQMVNGDQVVYSRMAEQIAQGNGLIDMHGVSSTIFMPLLPIFIAGVSFVLSDIITAGFIVEIFFGCLILIPAYFLGRELVSERVGLMTAALLMVLPLAVGFSTRIYTEGVYSFFLVTAAYFAWRMLHGGSLRFAAAAGVSIGLAYLANPAGVFYVVVFLILISIMAIRERASRIQYFKAGVLFLLPFLIFALPYVVYLHGELGKWTYTAKNGSDTIYATSQGYRFFTPEYEQTFSELSEDGTEVIGMKKWENSPDPVRFFLQNPKTYLRIAGNNMLTFYREEMPKVLPLWLLPLLGLGLFEAGWDRGKLKAISYTALLSSPIALIFAIEYRSRFFMPFVTFILVWFATGWSRLEQWGVETVPRIWVGETTRRRLIRLTPILIAGLVLVPPLLLISLDVRREGYKTDYRLAGEWLKDNAGSDQRIMDREENATFCAEGTVVQIPYADYGRSTNYARLKDVDYMIIDKVAIRDFRPGLTPLLEDESLHPEWRLVHSERGGPSGEVLVFELVK